MAVKTYSLKKDGNKKLSENFTVKEFACKDGSDKILIDSELVEVLQKVRNYFGKPVTLNSAYRNAAYNKKIGGASKSQHVCGTAADTVVHGVDPKKVAQYAEYLMPNKGGIGLYAGFTHIDVRSNRARWKNYGSEVGVSGFPGHKNKSFETVEDIVSELNRREIITDTVLWLKKLREDSTCKALAQKCANKTTNCMGKKDLTEVNDIVWELNHMGIMDSKDYWLDKLSKDTSAYWLARKIAYMTKKSS